MATIRKYDPAARRRRYLARRQAALKYQRQWNEKNPVTKSVMNAEYYLNNAERIKSARKMRYRKAAKKAGK